MKSPHLLSTVHDLAILHTISSVITKRKDFITTQIVVSQYSADSFMIAFPTNHALMPHFDNTSLLVSRALVVHPPRRKKPTDTVNASMDLSHPIADTHEVTIGIPAFCALRGRVLILAQERPFYRHRQRSPQSYTSARSLLGRSTLHHNRTPANRFSCHHLQPYQYPASLPKKTTVVLFNAVVLGSTSVTLCASC